MKIGFKKVRFSEIINLFNILSYIDKKINPFLVMFATAATSVMCTAALLGVISRYIMRSPFGWTEALARYFMIIMGLFGMTLVLDKRENVKVDFLFLRFNIVLRKIFEIIYDILIIVFILILIYKGYFYAIEGLGQRAENLPFSMMYVYIFLPLCATVMLIKVIKRILSNFIDLRGK